jgi:RHS repeat-associated protein
LKVTVPPVPGSVTLLEVPEILRRAGRVHDEPLAMLRSSATSYYHADGLGSITSLSNAAGSVVQTYTFDSFGKQTSSTGSLTNPFQYTARESDPETGLYYYRARYYDASTGRFLTEDRIGFLSGIDFYTYVRNAPTKYRDPSGKDPIIGVTVGAIAGTIQGALVDRVGLPGSEA